jgi:hypothetical protein
MVGLGHLRETLRLAVQLDHRVLRYCQTFNFLVQRGLADLGLGGWFSLLGSRVVGVPPLVFLFFVWRGWGGRVYFFFFHI